MASCAEDWVLPVPPQTARKRRKALRGFDSSSLRTIFVRGRHETLGQTLLVFAEVAMTVKQLIRKLQHPPCKRIAAVRIEFADGGIYEVSPDTRRISPSKLNPRTLPKIPGNKPATS